jgi:3',5'-cyclic AMP phosphodiesterase CpdA
MMLLAQISDFHLKPNGALAYGAADTAGALEKVVAHINQMNPLPDLVIATGDLADGGSPESYRLAYELLAPLKPPLYIVPGNHDQKDNLAAAFPDHKYLWQRIQGRNGSYICYVLENFPIRLIGLDTVTPGEHGGGLGPIRLDWLNRKLEEKPATPTLIFMHHPPFASGIAHMDIEPFNERQKFRELIEKHSQVERIACGHIHRPISCRFAGTVATVCPGVGMQIVLDFRTDAPSGFTMEPAAMLIHRWEAFWDGNPVLLTHTSIVEDFPGQYGGFHPFFDVVNPG